MTGAVYLMEGCACPSRVALAFSKQSMPQGKATPGATQLQAREGVMTLAGRERKCFVLTLPILGSQELKMIFTEAGELARIDLPEGYSLLEPMIYGLQDGNL